LLKKTKIKLSAIKRIYKKNRGGSFTALRIGVVTANALGYALGVPVEEVAENDKGLKRVKKSFKGFNIIKPVYDKEPNITIKNSKNSL